MDETPKMRNNKNSSITRVRPILGEMFKRISSGQERLKELLANAPNKQNLGSAILQDPGKIESWCRRKRDLTEKGFGISRGLPEAFEKEVPPPGAFLRWMISNPHLLEKPVGATWGEETTRLRNSLLDQSDDDHERVRQRALLEFDTVGATGSRSGGKGQWWAFEGYSHIDCVVETDKLVLFIEGKRSEPASQVVSWYPFRNQIARNLECARQFAGTKGKEFAVLMVVDEEETKYDHAEETNEASLLASWPHYKDDEAVQRSLMGGFLGIVTWQQIIGYWNLEPKEHYLPETTSVAFQRFYSQ